MRFVTNANRHNVLRLPVWVGSEALRSVLEEIASPGRRALLILDFQATGGYKVVHLASGGPDEVYGGSEH